MPSVTQSFVLEYPNGREHECAVEVERELSPGDVIDLVGRRWRVAHIRKQGRSISQQGRSGMPQLVCTPMGGSPLTKR